MGRHYTVGMKFSCHLARLVARRSGRGGHAAVRLRQQPTFRAGVTLVSTDVIPRDASGRFVADLTRENFTVLEDGQPQTIDVVLRWSTAAAPSTCWRRRRRRRPRPKASCCRRPRRARRRHRRPRPPDLHRRPALRARADAARPQAGADDRRHADSRRRPGGGGFERPVVHRDRPDLRQESWSMEAVGKIRGSGLIPSEIFKIARDPRRGPADIRDRAQMAFYTAYNILGDLEQRQQQAQGGDLHQHRLRLRSVRRRPQQQGSHPGRTLLGSAALSDRRGATRTSSIGRVTADIDLHS